MQICRLSDPVKSNGKKRNVTVKALPLLLSAETDTELEKRIAQADVATKFARDWRNRRIAHADEDVRLGRLTLNSASRAKLNDAIEAIAACVRRYARIELDLTLVTHPIGSLVGDEVTFLTALYHGNCEIERIKEHRNHLIQRGEWWEFERSQALPEWLTKRSEPKYDID